MALRNPRAQPASGGPPLFLRHPRGRFGDRFLLLPLGERAQPLGIGAAMAHDLVAACAKRGDEVGRVVVHRAVDQRRHGQPERVESVEQIPGADAIAVVAPGIIQHVGMRPARHQLGAQALAEMEMLEVECEIDRQSPAVRPCVVGTAAQRRITITAWEISFMTKS